MSKTNFIDSFKKEMTEKYFDMVYRLVLTRTKDKHIAEDVCQDVFLKYIKSDKVFESEEHIKAWLIRVSINTSKSYFASSWHKKTVPLSEELVFSDPEKSDLFEKVQKLSSKYSMAVLSVDCDGVDLDFDWDIEWLYWEDTVFVQYVSTHI